MKKKICIIEDEKDIVRLISYNLEKEGYEVISYGSGEDAFEFIKTNRPNLILLDIMIPVLDGFEVCKQLKSSPDTQSIPLIMISAKAEESNIVTGLELGADDYITKPFSVAVLIARVRTALRRTIKTADTSEKVLSFEGLDIYPDRYEVYVDKEQVNFNHTEFKLLCCLASQPGRVFSRLQMIDFMKGESYFVTQRLVDVLLVSIRKKLGNASSLIQTVRGVGYKFKSQV
ncbi:response regulator transcription factor [bacterium]|jgi:two-component system, OmpR family, alkaline phosphatase synthesis response regulator PhoP|nr:response regulator transcription factor [bacterium]